MSFTASEWSQMYDTTKRQIITQRRAAQKLPDSDVQALRKNIKTLDSQLKVMSSNLMEYGELLSYFISFSCCPQQFQCIDTPMFTLRRDGNLRDRTSTNFTGEFKQTNAVCGCSCYQQ